MCIAAARHWQAWCDAPLSDAYMVDGELGRACDFFLLLVSELSQEIAHDTIQWQ